MFKVGDKVRVIKVTTLESLRGVKIGDIFTLTDRSWTPRNPDVLLLKSVDGYPIVLEVEQVELVRKFKLGDHVRGYNNTLGREICGFIVGVRTDVKYYLVKIDDLTEGERTITHNGGGFETCTVHLNNESPKTKGCLWVDEKTMSLFTDTKPSKDEQLLQQLFDLAHEVVVLESQDSVTWGEVEQLEGYKEQIMQLVLGMVRNND